MATPACAEEHFAPVDHEPSKLDVRGSLVIVGPVPSLPPEKRRESGQHFASGPRSGSCYQTASRVGQDQRVEFALETRESKLVM